MQLKVLLRVVSAMINDSIGGGTIRRGDQLTKAFSVLDGIAEAALLKE
jgi:hypothetical protein